MSNKFDNIIGKFLTELADLSNAEAQIRSAANSLPPTQQGEFISKEIGKATQKPNDPNNPIIDSETQNYIDGLKKVVTNPTYTMGKFLKDNPNFKNHKNVKDDPDIQKMYTPSIQPQNQETTDKQKNVGTGQTSGNSLYNINNNQSKPNL